MTSLASQHLTKSRYIAGLQCPRRLWLVVHEPTIRGRSRLAHECRAEIGPKAHLLFPGACGLTKSRGNTGRPCGPHGRGHERCACAHIFEAAFEYEDIRIRVDVCWSAARPAPGGCV